MKKVLIITYYFPPAGGPGVQRWLKFVKYLPEFGVIPIIYIPENPTYPIIDEKLLDEIPKDLTILKIPIWEPFKVARIFSKKTTKLSSGIIPTKKKQRFLDKVLLAVRGNFFIPDARRFWVKPSVKFLKKYIEENKIETIITSGPPHSLHLIGLSLSQKCNLRWLADFRDPWTTIGYHKKLKLGAYAKNRHKQLEKNVLSSADAIIVTSKTTKNEFSQSTSKPIHVITNGFDNDFKGAVLLGQKFSIAHIGSLLSERNPEVLWTAIAEIAKENADFSRDLELRFVGLTSPEILRQIKKRGLGRNVVDLGYISHEQALIEQRRAQILLLIEIDSAETRSIIPAKLFEYMAAKRPIIAVGPKDSDFESILNETKSGRFFQYHQKTEIKKVLEEMYESYLNRNLVSTSINIEKYSRRNLTGELAKIILE